MSIYKQCQSFEANEQDCQRKNFVASERILYVTAMLRSLILEAKVNEDVVVIIPCYNFLFQRRTDEK